MCRLETMWSELVCHTAVPLISVRRNPTAQQQPPLCMSEISATGWSERNSSYAPSQTGCLMISRSVFIIIHQKAKEQFTGSVDNDKNRDIGLFCGMLERIRYINT